MDEYCEGNPTWLCKTRSVGEKFDQIIDRKYFPEIINSLCPTLLERSKRLNGRRTEKVTIEYSSSFWKTPHDQGVIFKRSINRNKLTDISTSLEVRYSSLQMRFHLIMSVFITLVLALRKMAFRKERKRD